MAPPKLPQGIWRWIGHIRIGKSCDSQLSIGRELLFQSGEVWSHVWEQGEVDKFLQQSLQWLHCDECESEKAAGTTGPVLEFQTPCTIGSQLVVRR